MSTQGKLTGRKVALIFITFFGVILAANVTLMVNAIGTFSGLIVPNSYVASQAFDADREAQEALGWQLAIDYRNEAFYLSMQDASGRTVRPAELRVVVGRSTTEAQDKVMDLVATPEGFAAPVPLDPGNWRVDISARADDGTSFVQRRSLFVPSDAS
jgi:nitrogen fixation protein FixH